MRKPSLFEYGAAIVTISMLIAVVGSQRLRLRHLLHHRHSLAVPVNQPMLPMPSSYLDRG